MLPNYRDGSIVNLMSTIGKSFGQKSLYNPLKVLPKLDSKDIVLIVIDGMGYEFVRRYGEQSFMSSHMADMMTSVFPSTTAAAITTFATGVAPQQHGITGWFMFLKEAGSIVKILPYQSRFNSPDLGDIRIWDIIEPKAFSVGKAKSYRIVGRELLDSEYTTITSLGSQSAGYRSLKGMFRGIRSILDSGRDRKFIYAYWSELDTLCHAYGVRSRIAEQHFMEIDAEMEGFIRSLKKKDVSIIVTADHGLIDTPKKKLIDLDRYPVLKDCLSIPLCGEARAPYCYVHPDRAKDFEAYVYKRLSGYCELHKSKDLIAENYYGLYRPHKELHHRIGDYVLFMKDDYVMRDTLKGQSLKYLAGNHGGTTKEEMFVPLILFRT